MCCGIIAGVVSSSIANPTDVLKVSLTLSNLNLPLVFGKLNHSSEMHNDALLGLSLKGLKGRFLNFNPCPTKLFVCIFQSSEAVKKSQNLQLMKIFLFMLNHVKSFGQLSIYHKLFYPI